MKKHIHENEEECKVIKVHVFDIDWDVEGEEEEDEEEEEEEDFGDDQISEIEELGLPSEIDIEVEVYPGDSLDDAVVDTLSDIYGFCVNGCDYEEV